MDKMARDKMSYQVVGREIVPSVFGVFLPIFHLIPDPAGSVTAYKGNEHE